MGQDNRPVVEMFWLVEYKDGSYCAQFDFDQMVEHRYAEVNHKRAKRYWWIPVPPGMNGQLGLRHNPRLKKHCVENRGAMGFVARRTKLVMNSGSPVKVEVMCYVVGIEAGPRIEIYPNGTTVKIAQPHSESETQDILRG